MDHSKTQLIDYKVEHEGEKPAVLTNSAGAPIGDKLNLMTLGSRGPALMKDVTYMDEMAHFDRERIPERVVHAKGGGAFGYFECTHDITKYTKAVPFAKIGKRTPLVARFSTVAGESGSSDTVRDPRGFALKFYTEEGNWDLVGNNTPIFFIRDPILFPSFIHTQKRNPKTHLKDPNAVWDFQSLCPESIHQFLLLFSDRGIPDGFRHMNGYGSHTYKMVNAEDEAVFCKFHFKTNQGIKNLPKDKAGHLAGSDPDYSLRDLYNAIENKNYPSWTLKIQVMTMDQSKSAYFNPFDLTKIWPQKDYPLIEVGKLVLDKNPTNYFMDIEQLGFCPSTMIAGIEPSPDKMLQGRLFSYKDTLRHRLGANFNLLPVNKPRCPYANYEFDGPMRCDNNNGDQPNYFPNSFNGPRDDRKYLEHKQIASGEVARHDSADDDNFSQPAIFYNKVLKPDEKARLAVNLAEAISEAVEFIRARCLTNFGRVSQQLATDIEKHMESFGVKTNH